MSGRIFLDEIYSKDGQNKVLDTKSFDANNNFTTSNTGFRLNYQTANAALIINQTGAGDALSVKKNIKFSSGGIDFGTTTSGSGTVTGGVLDDYEEGSWTPVVVRSAVNPSGTPTTAIGYYTKIGNVVHVQGKIALDGFSGGSGQWKCSLPFTHASNGTKAGLNKGRIYMDGDSADRQYRISPGTNEIGLHIPSNDQGFNSNITYLIWEFSGTYLI